MRTDLFEVIYILYISLLYLVNIGIEVIVQSLGWVATLVLFFLQRAQDVPVDQVAVGDDLLCEAQLLIRPLASLVEFWLLHQHRFLVASLYLVLEVVSVVLSCHSAVLFLDCLRHELVLVHVVSKSSISS